METGHKQSTENFVKEVRRRTRRVFTSEQKILIVMEAMRGELSTAVTNWGKDCTCERWCSPNLIGFLNDLKFLFDRKTPSCFPIT